MNESDGVANQSSRREFLAAGVGTALFSQQIAHAAAASASSLLDVDYQALVSRADLHYTSTPPRSEDGIPVGNGRMGTLVWLTPSALRFQINRVDVYGNNSYSRSFPERNTDYCGGCAFVDIDCGGHGDDPFPAQSTTQHLSVYDALLAVNGNGVSARLRAWHEADVIAFEISDRRERPAPIEVSLRILRYACFRAKLTSCERNRSRSSARATRQLRPNCKWTRTASSPLPRNSVRRSISIAHPSLSVRPAER
jgi:hypothetical protein